mgnify:CR=1 FL=1
MKEHQIIDMIMTLKLSNTSKLIFVALARRLDWSTWSKAMSVSYIYNMLGGSVSQRSISRALAELVAMQLITRTQSERADNTKLITLNTSELVKLSTAPPAELDPDTMSPPDTMTSPDTMSPYVTMSDLTPCHDDPDTMSDQTLTPCHDDPDTMSDNKLYITLNNNSLKTLSTDKSSQGGSAFQFSNEEDDPEIPDDVNSEQTNHRIKDYFKRPSEPVQPVMSIQEERRTRELKIMEAQDRMSRSYRKR